MRNTRLSFLIFTCLLSFLCSSASCSTVAGVANPSCLSHQMNVLRVGQELGRRGHKFVWLISDSKPSSRRLAREWSFENLVVLEYKAVNESSKLAGLSRNPMKVRQSFRPAVLRQESSAQIMLGTGVTVPQGVGSRSAAYSKRFSLRQSSASDTQRPWQVLCPATCCRNTGLLRIVS